MLYAILSVMRTIPLGTDGKYHALIDDKDYELISQYSWRALVQTNPRTRTERVCACTTVQGQIIYMHKLITGYEMTDHKDHDSLNNTRANLRECTKQTNAWNSNKRAGCKGSKYIGVAPIKGTKNWQAYITTNGKRRYLGSFTTEISAAEAYNQVALAERGEWAVLNELQEK